MENDNLTSQPAKADFLGLVHDGIDLEVTWRFLCPQCGASFDTEYDARDKEVTCDHCPWKGVAGS